MHRHLGSLARLLTPIVFAVGCKPGTDLPAAPSRGESLTSAFFSTSPIAPRDVRAVEMELAASPLPWDASDSALVSMVTAGGGILTVAIKESSAPRARDVATTRSAKGARMGLVGNRASVRATTIDRAVAKFEAQGIVILKYLASIGAVIVSLDPRLAPAIRADSLVDYVTPRVPGAMRLASYGGGRARAAISPVASSQTTPWGIQTVGATIAWAATRGAGAKILLLDTGIENGHEDLPTLTPSSNCPGPQGGCDDGTPLPHGTAMAGILLARDNALGVVGVAPDLAAANFHSYGACDSTTGLCDPNEIAGGLDWAITNLFGPQVTINMSLGGCVSFPQIANAVAQAKFDGFVMVAAAGNIVAGGPCQSGEIFYPAGYTGVLGVSGLLQNLTFAQNVQCTTLTNQTITASSNRGSHVDIAAPFVALSAQIATFGTYSEHCGTSQATAHVSAVAALVRLLNPGWSNLTVINHLQSTAKDLGAALRDDFFGYGLVDAVRAVGIVPPTISASIVSQRPRLSWGAIPGTASYRIYRRVNPTQSEWTFWASSSSLSYTDAVTKVSSFYGYSTVPPTGTSVSYYVTALTTTGYETQYGSFGTYIPIGVPPT